ncbi:GNAT family N-acetyltransferase [Halioxenophilus aromaticivorans]|uniref:N-acetyltransferase domain-containing protein n=1 Tax=Halioxenophilus aromaticivorans TaxID=1306992 RepID=A0AAV3UA98_9ALTE
MESSDALIKIVDWDHHQELLLTVRRTVFMDEQKVSEADEIDGKDPEYIHVLCTQQGTGEVIGCARISKAGKIGRVAVLKPFRQGGYGGRVMAFCNDYVLRQGQSPHLDAQVEALPFYEKLGYEAQGPVFMDANIPHRKMVLATNKIAGQTTDATSSFANAIALGGRKLFIFCPASMLAWLASDAITQAIKTGLLNGRVESIAIILGEKNPDQRTCSALVQLAQRLPSKISLRCCSGNAEPITEVTLLDNQTLWRGAPLRNEPQPSRFTTDALSLQQRAIHQDQFTRMWEHQTWDNPNLRSIVV